MLQYQENNNKPMKLSKKRSRGLWPGRYCWTAFLERLTSTGSETFSLLIFLDSTKIVLLSVFTLIKAIFPKIWAYPLPKNEKIHFRLTSATEKAYKLPDYLCAPHDTFIQVK